MNDEQLEVESKSVSERGPGEVGVTEVVSYLRCNSILVRSMVVVTTQKMRRAVGCSRKMTSHVANESGGLSGFGSGQ